MNNNKAIEWGVLALAVCSQSLHAEEIAPFRFDYVDGYVNTQYSRDGYDTVSTGTLGGTTHQQQGNFRTEIFMNGRGYIYHPNLVTLDIGGGPILQRQSYSSSVGENTATTGQYNLKINADVLKDKPYRGKFYLEHLNPTQSIAPGLVMTQENLRYGADLSLVAKEMPLPVNLSLAHSESKGKGSDRVASDSADQVTFRTSRSFGGLGNTQLQYQTINQTSMSGSSLDPIVESRNSSKGLNLETHLRFGPKQVFDLTQLLTKNWHSYDAGALQQPNQGDTRWMFDLRHRPSKEFEEFLVWNNYSNHQGAIDSRQESKSAGLFYRPLAGLELAATGRAETSSSNTFTTKSDSINGTAAYARELSFGTLQAGYSLNLDKHSQNAGSSVSPVMAELQTLSGLQYAKLANGHVTAGSVIVTNAARTQVFIENVDYQLTVVGNETRIQRVAGGKILDGEQVYIDYSYDIGGTYAYKQTDQNLNLGWSYGSLFNVYYRYLSSNPQLVSGETTYPLNIVKSSIWGVRGETPIRESGWNIGAGYETEHRAETIAPFRRVATDAYVQNDEVRRGFGSLRVATRRNVVDYGNPLQNVNLIGIDIRYSNRVSLGWEVSGSASRETDVGGLAPRKHAIYSVNAQFKQRKLVSTLSFTHTSESQGEVQNSRNLFQWVLRRDF